MTDNISKLRPGEMYSLDDLISDAKARGITKAILVGKDDDGVPYCNATNSCMLSELAWMALIVLNQIQSWMRD